MTAPLTSPDGPTEMMIALCSTAMLAVGIAVGEARHTGDDVGSEAWIEIETLGMDWARVSVAAAAFTAMTGAPPPEPPSVVWALAYVSASGVMSTAAFHEMPDIPDDVSSLEDPPGPDGDPDGPDAADDGTEAF